MSTINKQLSETDQALNSSLNESLNEKSNESAIGIFGNLEAGQAYLGSPRNTWGSIGILRDL